MKTHMDIDEQLLDKAMKLGGHTTKRDAVHAALEAYVRRQIRRRLRTLAGTVDWQGDLDVMRDRLPRAEPKR